MKLYKKLFSIIFIMVFFSCASSPSVFKPLPLGSDGLPVKAVILMSVNNIPGPNHSGSSTNLSEFLGSSIGFLLIKSTLEKGINNSDLRNAMLNQIEMDSSKVSGKVELINKSNGLNNAKVEFYDLSKEQRLAGEIPVDIKAAKRAAGSRYVFIVYVNDWSYDVNTKGQHFVNIVCNVSLVDLNKQEVLWDIKHSKKNRVRPKVLFVDAEAIKLGIEESGAECISEIMNNLAK